MTWKKIKAGKIVCWICNGAILVRAFPIGYWVAYFDTVDGVRVRRGNARWVLTRARAWIMIGEIL